MGMLMIANGYPSRLTILPRINLHLHFLATRPTGARCAICRGFRHQHPKRAVVLECDRCGVEFADTCYWRKVASPRELVLREVGLEEELKGAPFVCHGCRS